MQLFQSWKESAAIFGPKNLKLFLLVTVKSIITTYRALIRYCWLPLGLYIIGDLFVFGTMPFWLASPLGYYGVITLSNCMWGIGLIFLIVFLSARPSVVRKDYWYFFSYWYYCVYILLFMLLGALFKTVLITYIGAGIIYNCYLFAIMVWSVFFILFLLDSDGTVIPALLALWRGLKMIVFNMPAIIVLLIVAFVISIIVTYPIVLLSNLVVRIIPIGFRIYIPAVLAGLDHIGFLISMLIVTCFMTNFYIKRLHDQFGLYFDTK